MDLGILICKKYLFVINHLLMSCTPIPCQSRPRFTEWFHGMCENHSVKVADRGNMEKAQKRHQVTYVIHLCNHKGIISILNS